MPLYAYAGGMAYFLAIKFPYTISLNFSFPSKAKTKLFFDTKEFFLEHGASAKARVQKEEIKAKALQEGITSVKYNKLDEIFNSLQLKEEE